MDQALLKPAFEGALNIIGVFKWEALEFSCRSNVIVAFITPTSQQSATLIKDNMDRLTNHVFDVVATVTATTVTTTTITTTTSTSATTCKPDKKNWCTRYKTNGWCSDQMFASMMQEQCYSTCNCGLDVDLTTDAPTAPATDNPTNKPTAAPTDAPATKVPTTVASVTDSLATSVPGTDAPATAESATDAPTTTHAPAEVTTVRAPAVETTIAETSTAQMTTAPAVGGTRSNALSIVSVSQIMVGTTVVKCRFAYHINTTDVVPADVALVVNFRETKGAKKRKVISRNSFFGRLNAASAEVTVQISLSSPVVSGATYNILAFTAPTNSANLANQYARAAPPDGYEVVVVVTTSAAVETTTSLTTIPTMSTGAPVTEVPTTETPTTDKLATDAPTTAARATEAPTTVAPAAEVPTTAAPVTEAPRTTASATDAPSTVAPAMDALTTAALTTEAPATAKPVTDPLTTDAPATDPPTSEAPATTASAKPSTTTTTTATNTATVATSITTLGAVTRTGITVFEPIGVLPLQVTFTRQSGEGTSIQFLTKKKNSSSYSGMARLVTGIQGGSIKIQAPGAAVAAVDFGYSFQPKT